MNNDREMLASFDLAFCRIFAKQDALDTRVYARLGKQARCADLPQWEGRKAADAVTLLLAGIALEGRR